MLERGSLLIGTRALRKSFITTLPRRYGAHRENWVDTLTHTSTILPVSRQIPQFLHEATMRHCAVLCFKMNVRSKALFGRSGRSLLSAQPAIPYGEFMKRVLPWTLQPCSNLPQPTPPFQIHWILMSGNTTQLTTTGGNYWTNHSPDADPFKIEFIEFNRTPPKAKELSQLRVTIGLDVKKTMTPSGGNSNKDPHAWVILDGKDLELSSFNVLKSINKARGAEKKATIAKGQYHIKWEMSATIINFLRTRGITITANTQIIISGRNGKAADAREIFRFQLHLS